MAEATINLTLGTWNELNLLYFAGSKKANDDASLFKYVGDQSKYPGALIFKSSLIRGGITIGPLILVEKNASTGLIQHEYGHTLQYGLISLLAGGPIIGLGHFLAGIGVPSILSAGLTNGKEHLQFPTEKAANTLSNSFFNTFYGSPHPINNWPRY